MGLLGSAGWTVWRGHGAPTTGRDPPDVLQLPDTQTESSHIQWVILVGIFAAVMGDNLGYLLGRRFGKTFIRWIKKLLRLDDLDVDAAMDLISRHGGKTIFLFRWIFCLRTIAGPMAGSLGMPWRRFFEFNFLGAATWVVAMAFIGHSFANEFNTLLGYIEKASWAIAAGLITVGYLIWRRQKHRYRERHLRNAA
jgi:membrane protein DedA with SNARE-associated domain